MKKNSLQKLLAVALVGVMAVGTLTACGDTATSTSTSASVETSTSTEASTSTEPEKEAVAGMEGWEPFAEKVTLTIPVYERGAEGIPRVGENYWEKWIQENFGDAYNIDVKFQPITRSAVMNDYSLLAAADTLPTICAEYDYPKMTQWINDGYLQTYDTEQFKLIAPTYWAAMEDAGITSFTAVKGEDYFVIGTRPYSNANYTWVTFYRQDWLEACGLTEYPTTWAEEKAMFLKIKELGLAKYPMGGEQIAGAGVDQNYGYRTYPQDELLWATTGDYNIPALSTDAQKNLIARENEAYNLGLKNPEYDITTHEDAKAMFVNGELMSWGTYTASNIPELEAFYAQNPDAKLAIKVTKGFVDDPEGKSSNAYGTHSPFGMMIGFSHTATADQVKAAMMYLEWLSQPDNLKTMQWGFEGDNYNNVDGSPVAVALGDYTGEHKQGHNNNVDYWCLVTAIKSLGTIEQDVAAVSPQGLPKDFTQEIIDNYNGMVKVWEAGYAQPECLFATTIEAEAEYQQALTELYAKLRNELTMCKPEEFEAKYEAAKKEYLEAGYQAVIDGRKEAFEAGLGSHLK